MPDSEAADHNDKGSVRRLLRRAAKAGITAAPGGDAAVRAAEAAARAATEAAKGIAGAPADLARGLLGHKDDERAAAAKRIGVDRADYPDSSDDELAARGADLLRMSYSAALQPTGEHPAFRRILDDITPDEARILRFLDIAGPQPAIDVRTKKLFGVGSTLIAANHSMIARMSGCIDPDQDLEYFANLERLGLLEYSREPVLDPRRYSLIECQPRSMKALHGSGRKTYSVYRSIHLTPFGTRFCSFCFERGDYDGGGWAEDPRGDRIYMTERRKRKLARKLSEGSHH